MPSTPQDIYIGVVDFFAILIPGVVAAFLLCSLFRKTWHSIRIAPKERLVLFFIGSFLLGHFLHAFGAIIDGVYSKIYMNEKLQGCDVKSVERLWFNNDKQCCNYKLLDAAIAKAPDYPYFTAGGGRSDIEGDKLEYFHRWVRENIRAKAPHLSTRLDMLEGVSKLFRSLFVISIFIVVYCFCLMLRNKNSTNVTIFLVMLVVLLFSGWRYGDKTYKRRLEAFEYFIVVQDMVSKKISNNNSKIKSENNN